MDERPRSIGRYEVVSSLGEGGFGSVWLARDPMLERRVAIKVPRGAHWESDAVLAEARALARLQHPAIVQVLDAGRDPALDPRRRAGVAFLVLEHVDGRDLEAELRLRGRLSPQRALAWLEGPAAALDHAHSLGVFHRDVKPANLLRPRGDGPVKVLDFGLADLAARHGAGHGAGHGLHAPHGTAPAAGAPPAGDPRYAPPEAWRGTADALGDVHALAAVFFELVTGRAPVPGASVGEQIEAARSGRRIGLRELQPALPRSLDAACSAALSPRRHERPRTAAALLRSLGDALERERAGQRLLDDARERIRARESAPLGPRECPECGEALNPRARSCPRCDVGPAG